MAEEVIVNGVNYGRQSVNEIIPGTNVTALVEARTGGGVKTTLTAASEADSVIQALYDANTILIATTDNTPVPLTVGASTIVGRKASGAIVALTGAEALTITGAQPLDSDLTAIAALTTTAFGRGLLALASAGSAYTQTYSTADKTVAARTASALTDNTAGTANTTLQALADGTLYTNDVAAIRNNFADLAAAHNAVVVDLLDTTQALNAVIDDLQALGLVG